MRDAKAPVVWDLPVRVGHWALVGLILACWATAEYDLMDWHRRAGYAVLAALVFRICWGFVGSDTARFGHFVKGPALVWRYVGTLRDRRPGRHSGHNPLGAISVIALLLVLFTQVTTGLFAVDVDGIESGPLSDRVSFDSGRWLAHAHHLSFLALEGLIVLHLAAIGFYGLYKRENLVWPMITGRGAAGVAGTAKAPRWRFFVSFALAALIAWFIARGLRI